MRKLKLQVQMSVDGFVARPKGELDWMTWDWDDELKSYTKDLTDSFDIILLGRKMTDGFVSHWTNVVRNPKNPDYESAKIFVETPKIVFSRTLEKSEWDNTEIAKGDFVQFINQLKENPGKDIIVYGGAGFVSSLIGKNLIDEYYLFVNPAAIGEGMTIFNTVDGKLNLKLVKSSAFDCGIVVNKYEPKTQ